jgi:methylated-DNA-[protein]-cysteine S-methyltransferase
VVFQLAVCESPVGPLTVAARDGRLVMVRFGAEREAAGLVLRRHHPAASIAEQADPAGAVSALEAYFGGDLGALDGLPVDFLGTPFQQRVWSELRKISAGRTASYLDIARAIGSAASPRAVGAANGANPVAIVVPCHRIIGTSGALVGYGGGLERKRWLLQHEGILLKM